MRRKQNSGRGPSHEARELFFLILWVLLAKWDGGISTGGEVGISSRMMPRDIHVCILLVSGQERPVEHSSHPEMPAQGNAIYVQEGLRLGFEMAINFHVTTYIHVYTLHGVHVYEQVPLNIKHCWRAMTNKDT